MDDLQKIKKDLEESNKEVNEILSREDIDEDGQDDIDEESVANQIVTEIERDLDEDMKVLY